MVFAPHQKQLWASLAVKMIVWLSGGRPTQIPSSVGIYATPGRSTGGWSLWGSAASQRDSGDRKENP